MTAELERPSKGKRRYWRARRAGLCVQCFKAEPAPGKARCQPCLEHIAALQKARRKGIYAAGICVRCMSIPIKPGNVHCPACMADAIVRNRSYARDRHRRLIEAGLCTACGTAPPETGRKKCRACADRMLANWRKRGAVRLPGTCAHCHRRPVAEGRKNCEKCLQAVRDYRARLKAKVAA